MMELNDTVTVTLTKRGAEILNRKAIDLNEKFKSMVWKDDYKENDDYNCQLWELMEKIGAFCSAGEMAVFTNLRLKE